MKTPLNVNGLAMFVSVPRKLFCSVLLLATTLMLAHLAYAQEDAEEGEIRIINPNIDVDFKTLGGAEQRLEPHGSDLFGDLIDKNSGALQFKHTDVAIPGNSGLEVAIRRTIKQGNTYQTPHQHGFGDWALELPIAYVKFTKQENRRPPVFNNGCMTSKGDIANGFSIQDSQGGYGEVAGADLDEGLVLNIPGKGTSGRPQNSQSTSNFKFPSDPKSEHISGGVSTDFAGRCATVVIGPDGTRYKFGRHVFRGAPDHAVGTSQWVSREPYSGEVKWTYPIVSHYAVFLVTEVEDIHGNWVRYDYTNDFMAELTRIYSSDDREISIQYARSITSDPLRANPQNGPDGNPAFSSVHHRNSRQISRITAGGREWNYAYAGSNSYEIGKELDKVTLPDGRYWKIGDTSAGRGMWVMQAKPHTYHGCIPYDYTFSIKHPDGALGTFRVKETRHIRGVKFYTSQNVDEQIIMRPMEIRDSTSNNSAYCGAGGSPGTLYANPPWERPHAWPVYQAMSLVSKKISGAGIPTAEWKFTYRNYTGGPLDHNWTTVTDPVGTKTTYRYQATGPEFGLLKSVAVDSPNASQTITLEYDTTAKFGNGASNRCRAGGALGDLGGICASYDERPLTKRTLVRDGVTYVSEYSYRKDSDQRLLDYGSPSKITRYSNLQTDKRIKEASYWHNTSANILSRTQTIKENNRVSAEFTYNTKGQVTEQKEFGAKVATFGYHADGTLNWYKQWHTSSQNRTWSLSNYYRGAARTILRPDGHRYLKTLDYFGRTLSETDAMGYTTSYQYDTAGRLARIEPPAAWAPTVISYSNLGSGITQRATRGALVTTTYYDRMLRPTLVKTDGGEAQNIYTRTEYDALGRAIFSAQPSHSSTETKGSATQYDGLGRVVEVRETMAPYAKTTTQYLSLNQIKVTDALGHVSVTKKSGYGSPNDGETRSIRNDISETRITYDAWGKPTRVLQEDYATGGEKAHHVQRFYYDSRLRLCRKSVPEAGDTVYTYNNAGETTYYSEGHAAGSSCSLPSANRVRMVYDAMGRNTLIDYPGSALDITKTYDNNGNLKTLSNTSASWTYRYNDMNLLEEERLSTNGASYTLAYRYNASGHLDRMTYPGNHIVDYNVDGFGRAIEITGYVKGASYHPNGAVKSIRFQNNTTQTFGINARQLPSSVRVNNASGTALRHLSLSYDNNLNLSAITDHLQASYSNTFAYDALNRLTSASGRWGSGAISYDALGNITAKRMGSHSMSYDYDTKNRLDNISGSEVYLFDYDTRGNVTENTKQAFTYNLANQMTATSDGYHYAYDGHGKRVKKAKGSALETFVYTTKGQMVHKVKGGYPSHYIYLAGKLVGTTTDTPAFGCADNTYTYNASLQRCERHTTPTEQRTPSYSCPSGYSYVASRARCERQVANLETHARIPQCSSGYTYVASRNRCERTTTSTTSPSLSCPSGQTLSGGQCRVRLSGTQCRTHARSVKDCRYDRSGDTYVLLSDQEYMENYLWAGTYLNINWVGTSGGYVYWVGDYAGDGWVEEEEDYEYYEYIEYDYYQACRCDVDQYVFASHPNRSCPSGYSLSGSQCRRSVTTTQAPTYRCNSGYTYNSSAQRCERTVTTTQTTARIPNCSSGFSYNAGSGYCERILSEILTANRIVTRVDPVQTFIHNNVLGSPILKTNSAGSVLERMHYMPYGKTMAAGKGGEPGYTGHVYDDELELVYMQARYYDPVVGRFYSNDPVDFLGHVQRGNSPAHGFNRYAYANNNPYKYNDPDGEFAHIAIGAFAGGLISGIAYAVTTDNFNMKDLAVNVGTGALVGGVTAAVPGAIAAGALNFGSKAANITASGANAVAAGAGGNVVNQVATTGKVDTGKALVAGAANAAGLGAGTILSKPAAALATTKTAGNPGLPVTSLKGNTFMVGKVNSTSVTSEGLKQGLQDLAGETFSAVSNHQAQCSGSNDEGC